jgi:hypothetical protein
MPPLIAEEPSGNMQLRWVDPKVIEFIEALPRYGAAIIYIVDGRPTQKFTLNQDVLYTVGERHRE